MIRARREPGEFLAGRLIPGHPIGGPVAQDQYSSNMRWISDTLSVLVSEAGRFRMQLSEQADFRGDAIETIVLERTGQFCVWGPGLYHRWAVEIDCTILTLRWVPEST